jgi:hypothetical protein
MRISKEEFQLKFFKKLFMRLIKDKKNIRLIFEKEKIPLPKDERVLKNDLEKILEEISLNFIKEFKQDEKRMINILSNEKLLKNWILEKISELKNMKNQ